jgi:hypothetical protein
MPSLNFDRRTNIGFCCDWLPDGTGTTSWTLTTQLGALLHEAETRFGPRDKNWTILGIEYCGDTPMIWYPGNRSNISIMLTENAREDPSRAMFQLAHEVIHLLAPTGDSNRAPVIEEGLASIFAREISDRHGLNIHAHDARYLYAVSKVEPLLKANADAVRQLRDSEPNFSAFTPELICSCLKGISKSSAEELCEPFSKVDANAGDRRPSASPASSRSTPPT